MPQITAILTNFLQEEIRKTGLTKAVIGLSGGIDSAVVCALCAGSIGKDNVYTLCMPYKTSNPESERHARLCAEAFGVNYQVIEITRQIDSYFDNAAPDASALRRGNKMARERMTILYDYSAKLGGLVIGTSNKTELLLGYGTQHGDMASALNPIGDIYKTQIFELAKYLKIPEPIISKPPSADLWQGQSDEQEIGYTYAQIDALLADLIDKRESVTELKSKNDPIFVDKIISLIKKSQFKRRLPLIAKLSSRTIDREFRYPRDWGL
ncbi:adenine nucleotide alpha hydrolases superfamily [Candidatus Termititenax spirochaetophilus]|uniref:NH(3)-dependent NAD(+) synthetase n=1 Tax=Candidatus Termititenax spirochaetophilus TaxID=2218522 RepID=A0A388T9M7_9BACT|nr:adenine nucleotide alpha hydrolases superfamily [Candidatus Termititenax spirochaetophilus]